MSGIPVKTFYPRIPNKSCAISNLEKRHQADIDLRFRTQSVTSTPYHKLNYGHHHSLSPVDDSGYTSITSTINNSVDQEFQTPISGFFQHPGRQLAFTPLSPVPCERTIEYHPSFSEVSSRLDIQHDRDWEIPEDKPKFDHSYRTTPQHKLNFDEEDDESDGCFDGKSVCDSQKSSLVEGVAERRDISQYCVPETEQMLTNPPYSRLNFECDNVEQCDCKCSEEHYSPSTSPALIASSLADRFNEVLQKFSPKEPDRLIGRKMGLLCVDIVYELSIRNISALSVITNYLDPKDLCSFCQVSANWKTICDGDKRATNRRVLFLQQQREEARVNNLEKENFGKRLEHRSSRGMTDGERTFGMIQLTAPSSKSSTPSPTSENPFQSVASSLKNYECLRRCPKCQGPSKVLEIQDRGMCVQTDCGFDFCVKCLNNFHFEQACVPPSAKRPKTSIGSRKSKKNLRRL